LGSNRASAGGKNGGDSGEKYEDDKGAKNALERLIHVVLLGLEQKSSSRVGDLSVQSAAEG
jgi:hypothetical protein